MAALERDVRLVRCEDGILAFALAPDADPGLVQKLSKKLQDWTGRRWSVALSIEPAIHTIREQRERSARRSRASAPQASGRAGRAAGLPRRDGLPAQPKAAPVLEPEVSPQAVVNEDGDVVVGEMEFTEEDL